MKTTFTSKPPKSNGQKSIWHICFVAFCIVFIVGIGIIFQACFDVKIKTQTPSVGYYSLSSGITPRDCPQFLPIRLEVEVPSESNSTNIFIEGKNGRIESIKDAQWLDLPSNLIKTSLEAKAQSQCIALSSTNIDSKIPLLQVKIFSFGIAKKAQNDENLSANVNMNIRLSQDKKNELNANLHTQIEVAKSTDEQILGIKNALDKALDEVVSRINATLQGSQPK